VLFSDRSAYIAYACNFVSVLCHHRDE
jgi:hypothetical protein